jgi:enamine deaminase RidA (YjgF/YER057c/UK114 family)
MRYAVAKPDSESLSLSREAAMRTNISSGYDYEDAYGYSRAVRVRDMVFVSGTTARAPHLAGDAYVQAKAALATIGEALAEAGASLADVVRTVAYVIDMADMPQVARAHAEAFGSVKPASTLVQVSGLSPASARVEFEVTAVIGAAV